jgi:hypothetical protein
MAQLKRGGKQTLEGLLNKLAYIDHYAPDNPAAVRKLTQQIRDQLEEEIKPLLIRAAPDLERQVDELRRMLEAHIESHAEQSNVTRFRKAE